MYFTANHFARLGPPLQIWKMLVAELACLKPGCVCCCLQAGNENVAAFLETQRGAALKGATTEFEKLEGFAFGEH